MLSHLVVTVVPPCNHLMLSSCAMRMWKQLSLGVDVQVIDGIHTFVVVASASSQAVSSEWHLSSPAWVAVVALVCTHHRPCHSVLGVDTPLPTDGTGLTVSFVYFPSFSSGRACFHNFILILGWQNFLCTSEEGVSMRTHGNGKEFFKTEKRIQD